LFSRIKSPFGVAISKYAILKCAILKNVVKRLTKSQFGL